jgi:putative peptidoglycan lipid II flippase
VIQIGAGCILMTVAVLAIRHVAGDWNAMRWQLRLLWLMAAVAAGAAAYGAGLLLAGLRPKHLREA